MKHRQRSIRSLLVPLFAGLTLLVGNAAAATAASSSYSCSVQLGGSCGPYSYSAIPMSNGYDTYVSDQAVNVQSGGTETVNANSPGDWQVVANLPSCGGCVQTFPDAQQLTNDWCGSVTNWSSCASPTDTPLASLPSLKIHYAETPPSDTVAQYEFAPDIWNDNYSNDTMFWVDTSGQRCSNNGLSSSDILGYPVIGKQHWTLYHYGTELIFILNGSASTDPVSTGTCARQHSGTINVKAGLRWARNHGVLTQPVVLSQVNTGWEITQASNASFTVTAYSITAS